MSAEVGRRSPVVDSRELGDRSRLREAAVPPGGPVSQSSQKRWPAVVAVAIMLLAMFGYLASLDESDPEALPDAVEDSGDYGG